MSSSSSRAPILAATPLRTGKNGFHVDSAAEELESAVDANIRANDAGNCQRYVLDAAHVVAEIVEIQHPLPYFNLAPAKGLELQEGHRELQAEGEVLGQLILMILKKLMDAVNPDSPPKPCDYFDMIGGTSTGR